MQGSESLTDLIHLAGQGDRAALHRVFDAAYADLRQLARSRLTQSGRGVLLDTTSLVHESYLRFAKAGQLNIQDRQHFLRYAANVMRSVIVDCVRERLAERRGGEMQHIALSTNLSEITASNESEILRVHEALEELAQLDQRMAQVVEMRYFAGMTENEIADALGITDRTVHQADRRFLRPGRPAAAPKPVASFPRETAPALPGWGTAFYGCHAMAGAGSSRPPPGMNGE
jgi:RNA polymerase sigma factor (TIGR02999 family)